MEIKAITTRVFKEDENLLKFILQCIKKIPEGSVLVVTSKIVSLSEGRTREYQNEKQKIELFNQESTFALETKHVWLTIKDGTIKCRWEVDTASKR